MTLVNMCWELPVDSAQPRVSSWFSCHLLNYFFKKPGSRHFFRFSFISKKDAWSDQWEIYQKLNWYELYNICKNWRPLIFLRVWMHIFQVWLNYEFITDYFLYFHPRSLTVQWLFRFRNNSNRSILWKDEKLLNKQFLYYTNVCQCSQETFWQNRPFMLYYMYGKLGKVQDEQLL